MIDDKTPLPDHTKLNYYECQAKLILENCFPDRYHNLTLADKPDLQGDRIGIEVTIAGNQKMIEAEKIWNKANYSNEVAKKQYVERLEKLGVKYSGGVQSWPGTNASFESTKEAIEKKSAKVFQGEYKFYPLYELFVFSDVFDYSIVNERFLSCIYGVKVKKTFHAVYILSKGTLLHYFETESQIYKTYLVDSFKYANSARKMVLSTENDTLGE